MDSARSRIKENEKLWDAADSYMRSSCIEQYPYCAPGEYIFNSTGDVALFTTYAIDETSCIVVGQFSGCLDNTDLYTKTNSTFISKIINMDVEPVIEWAKRLADQTGESCINSVDIGASISKYEDNYIVSVGNFKSVTLCDGSHADNCSILYSINTNGVVIWNKVIIGSSGWGPQISGCYFGGGTSSIKLQIGDICKDVELNSAWIAQFDVVGDIKFFQSFECGKITITGIQMLGPEKVAMTGNFTGGFLKLSEDYEFHSDAITAPWTAIMLNNEFVFAYVPEAKSSEIWGTSCGIVSVENTIFTIGIISGDWKFENESLSCPYPQVYLNRITSPSWVVNVNTIGRPTPSPESFFPSITSSFSNDGIIVTTMTNACLIKIDKYSLDGCLLNTKCTCEVILNRSSPADGDMIVSSYGYDRYMGKVTIFSL